MLESLLNSITTWVIESGTYTYFYYEIFLFILFCIGIALSIKAIKKDTKRVSRRYWLALLLIILSFLIVELLFVKPTFQVYNDEYIQMDIAKTIITNHQLGVCSFATPKGCVPGTLGLFQQSAGWPMLLAIAFYIFGINFATAFNLVLLLSCFSIILIFLITYSIIDDPKTALLSAALLAATPWFLTYSRSTVLDISAMPIVLFAIYLLIVYIKHKKLQYGIAAVLVSAFATTMRIELIILLPIMLALLVLPHTLEFKKRRKILALLALGIVLVVIAFPQLIYVYTSNKVNSFGAPNNQKFSFTYLQGNLTPDTLFWFGAYTNINAGKYVYHDEYPIAYTLFAMAGIAYLVSKKKYGYVFSFSTIFLLIFLFFTGFYAGGVFAQAGANIRYYMDDFAIMAMLAAIGGKAIYSWTLSILHTGRAKRYKNMLVAIILIALFVMPIVYFINIVSQNPANIFPFAQDREELGFLLTYYNQVPSNCIVLSFKTPLWYILNKSTMYDGWFLIDSYRSRAINLSNGCIYLDYSTACNINNSETNKACIETEKEFDIQPVITERENRMGWNITIGLYKILGYKNGTPLSQ